MILTPTFQSWRCAGQRIFLRADMNVPLADGTILSDYRLRALQPTLDYLLNKDTQIILATHIGRPTQHDPTVSTQHLLPWFEHRGYTITFAETPAMVAQLPYTQRSIILLENLRFFPGEKKQSTSFAQELSALAPWYVNDAFGALHRTDTSITLLANRYKPTHRSIGFLIEKEIAVLSHLLHDPASPVCFILGGGKVADKLPLIQHLSSFADTIVLCPALVFTFLKAQGIAVGSSLVDQDAVASIATIMQRVKKSKTNLVFPRDYLIATHDQHGPLSYVDAHKIPADGFGIALGPKSLDEIKKIITQSATIFYNGMMGFAERKETLDSMYALMKTLSDSTATTIVAGGDSIAIVEQLGLTGITHCITGGGSTLAYLSQQPLPGLQPFLKNRTKTN